MLLVCLLGCFSFPCFLEHFFFNLSFLYFVSRPVTVFSWQTLDLHCLLRVIICICVNLSICDSTPFQWKLFSFIQNQCMKRETERKKSAHSHRHKYYLCKMKIIIIIIINKSGNKKTFTISKKQKKKFKLHE